MELKISKKVEQKSYTSKLTSVDDDIKLISKRLNGTGKSTEIGAAVQPGRWRFLYAFISFFILFALMGVSIIKLQIIEGEAYAARSESNQLRIRSIYPNRGVIMDRNGVKVAENVASYNVYVDSGTYYDKRKDEVDEQKLKSAADRLQKELGEDWAKKVLKTDENFGSVYDKMLKSLLTYGAYMESILVATDINDETAINVKAAFNEMPGVFVDDSTKRQYPFKEAFSHLLGYTSKVSAEDITSLDYIDANDIIGRTGIEKQYDKELIGAKGKVAVEVDARFNVTSQMQKELSKLSPGKSLYLTIDAEKQKKLYKTLEKFVKKSNGSGAAGVVEDVRTGEIIAIGSYPSYDSNAFVGGISQADYDKLLSDKKLPLFNRSITAQQPPGSIFKTLVASAALDAGALTTSTVYVSTRNYAFSNGAKFPDYHNNAYGAMTVIQGLEYSSNIFFCETIRHWDMDKLVPYLDRFGIGKTTGIDIPGEVSGRLPSPENKTALAKSSAPWLDPIWYPEGDSCNSVIGQGITLVTPIQAVNWISAIANGGTLQAPHVGMKLVDENGNEEVLKYEPLATKVASPSALSIVRTGMRKAVTGPKQFIYPLNWSKYQVAAKTGTAEFGRINSKGVYEHTHAWVIGFFPADNPKYAFSFFLEDGGSSILAAQAARDFLDSVDPASFK